MAFNPFTSFRKYQKFWMASLVLLSMITFVLCTGLGQGEVQTQPPPFVQYAFVASRQTLYG